MTVLMIVRKNSVNKAYDFGLGLKIIANFYV